MFLQTLKYPVITERKKAKVDMKVWVENRDPKKGKKPSQFGGQPKCNKKPAQGFGGGAGPVKITRANPK